MDSTQIFYKSAQFIHTTLYERAKGKLMMLNLLLVDRIRMCANTEISSFIPPDFAALNDAGKSVPVF